LREIERGLFAQTSPAGYAAHSRFFSAIVVMLMLFHDTEDAMVLFCGRCQWAHLYCERVWLLRLCHCCSIGAAAADRYIYTWDRQTVRCVR